MQLSTLGLTVNTVGAIVVLLPELPWFGRAMIGWGVVDDLDDAKAAFPVDVSGTETYCPDEVDWFGPVATVVQQNTGIEPEKLTWTADRETPEHTQLAIESPAIGTSYAVAEPTIIHQWIAAEQERIQERRRGYLLAVGAGLIALGFLLQLAA